MTDDMSTQSTRPADVSKKSQNIDMTDDEQAVEAMWAVFDILSAPDDAYKNKKDQASAIITALRALSWRKVGDGEVVVPRTMTHEMEETAIETKDSGVSDMWDAVLEVALKKMVDAVPMSAIKEPVQVNWNHVDGPLMSWAYYMHWLTPIERIMVSLRVTTIENIARRRWPPYRKYNPAMIAAAKE